MNKILKISLICGFTLFSLTSCDFLKSKAESFIGDVPNTPQNDDEFDTKTLLGRLETNIQKAGFKVTVEDDGDVLSLLSKNFKNGFDAIGVDIEEELTINCFVSGEKHEGDVSHINGIIETETSLTAKYISDYFKDLLPYVFSNEEEFDSTYIENYVLIYSTDDAYKAFDVVNLTY